MNLADPIFGSTPGGSNKYLVLSACASQLDTMRCVQYFAISVSDGRIDAAFECTAPALSNYNGESVQRILCLIEVLVLVLPSLVAWLI